MDIEGNGTYENPYAPKGKMELLDFYVAIVRKLLELTEGLHGVAMTYGEESGTILFHTKNGKVWYLTQGNGFAKGTEVLVDDINSAL